MTAIVQPVMNCQTMSAKSPPTESTTPYYILPNPKNNFKQKANRIWPELTEFGPPMWQAEADTELTLSASPATAVGQILLTMAKFC